jgi:plastocyanin
MIREASFVSRGGIMRLLAPISVLLVAAIVGCGGSSTAPSGGANNNNPPPPPPPGNTGGSTSNSIEVGNNFFDPSSTTVAVGTRITWSWNTCGSDGYGGQTCVQHGILFDDGTASGAQSEGSWSRTFTTAGTYKYHCTIHGAAMAGTIVVQ